MMNLHTSPEQWFFEPATNTTLVSTYDTSSPYSDLARLLHEKEVLETGLASCVMSLKYNRKKQLRNERQLSVEPPLSRKKRKSLQHINRGIEREIKNRERDEHAFLSNIQACKANIYVAECLLRSQLDLSPILPDISSNSIVLSTVAESEVTTPGWNGWNGWTDDAVISPFQKESSNTSFADDVAPDECLDGRKPSLVINRDLRRPPPIDPCSLSNDDELPAPPNTAQSFFQWSILSPVASSFEPIEPIATEKEADQPFIEGYFDQLSMSPSGHTKHRRMERRPAYVPTEQLYQTLPIQPLPVRPAQTGVRRRTHSSVPPHNRLTTGAGTGDGRRRTKSL